MKNEVIRNLMAKVDNETFVENYLLLLKDLYEEKRVAERELAKIKYKIRRIYNYLKEIDDNAKDKNVKNA